MRRGLNCAVLWTKRTSAKNSHQTYQRSLHPDKVNVECALSAEGIIEPFFFEDGDEEPQTIGERYRWMITEFLEPQIDWLIVDNMFLQQDGASDLSQASFGMTITFTLISVYLMLQLICSNN